MLSVMRAKSLRFTWFSDTSNRLALRSASALAQSIADFQTNGVAILADRIDEKAVTESKGLVMSAFKDALEKARKIRGRELQVGMEDGFNEICKRAEGRYDLLWRINQDPDHFLHEKITSKFMPFVHAILGEEKMIKMDYNGCFVALPGAKQHMWHVDGEHLFTSEGFSPYNKNSSTPPHDFDDTTVLPAHCMHVLIPLVDIDHINGGTEFCVGSHYHTKFWSDELTYPHTTWKERIGFEGDVQTLNLEAGQIVTLDYRLLHSALPHTGKEVRPMLYYTFSKRWFNDEITYVGMPSLTEKA